MLHFGRKSKSYWSVSLAKKRCIDAQPIITALSATIYILIRHQLDLSSQVTDLYTDSAGEIRAKAVYLKSVGEDIGAIWSYVKEEFRRLKHYIPFTKKVIASHTPADDDLLHYDTFHLAPFEGEQ